MAKYLISPKIRKEAADNTVTIESFNVIESCLNTGLIISPNKILTADHCLIGKTYIIKGEKHYPVDENNVAIKLITPGVTLLTLAQSFFHQPKIKISRKVEPGEKLFWTALLFAKVQGTFCYGYLNSSFVGRDGLTYYYIMGDICGGMSGSAVYNFEGEIIGMIMGLESTENKSLTAAIILPVQYFEAIIYYAREDLIIKPKDNKDEKPESEAEKKSPDQSTQ